MINSEDQSEILEYSLKVTNGSLLIEDENLKIKNKIRDFEKIINSTQLDLDLCRSKLKELNQKKLLIKNKREKLIDLQRNVIKFLSDDSILDNATKNPSDYIQVPKVLTSILEILYSATESQLFSKKIKIPISEVLDISDSFNEIFSDLVKSNVIDETEEESRNRNEYIAQNQQIFMNELLNTINTNDINDDNDSLDNTNDDNNALDDVDNNEFDDNVRNENNDANNSKSTDNK